MVVYPHMIQRHLNEELPFMATEELLMDAVRGGGDRQDLHETIRVHSQAAADHVKSTGQSNDLIDRLKGDPACSGIDFGAALDVSRYIGRAPEQVDSFIAEIIEPIRERYRDTLANATAGELKV